MIAKWADLEWQRRWLKRARNRTEATWRTPWNMNTLDLYEGLRKHEATALFLIRTEVIGLNAWLTGIEVPDILPRCACGWPAQTVRHVFMFCPNLARQRQLLVRQADAHSLDELLQSPASARAAARFLIGSNFGWPGTSTRSPPRDIGSFPSFIVGNRGKRVQRARAIRREQRHKRQSKREGERHA